jgi:hypothetical protein
LIKQANGGKDLPYEEYVQLLLVAAAGYDHAHVDAKGKRQVYQHDIFDDNYDP